MNGNSEKKRRIIRRNKLLLMVYIESLKYNIQYNIWGKLYLNFHFKILNEKYSQYYQIIITTVLILLYHSITKKISRSNCPEVKGVLRNFTKFPGKHLRQSFFFNKVVGLRPATLSKKKLWHRCFRGNFVTFLRTLFFTEYLRWLLLNMAWGNKIPMFICVREDQFSPIFQVLIFTDQEISDFQWWFTFTKKEIS